MLYGRPRRGQGPSRASGTGAGEPRSTAARPVGDELGERYGADYAVAVCGSEDDLSAEVARLEGQGIPIAAFLAGLGPEDPDGLGVLARSGGAKAGAVRACIVRWGDLETAAPVFEAITLGRLDGWLYRPERPGDEEFHLAVTELLAEWAGRQGSGFEAVQVIGERWSPRSQELRDMFDRNRVPTGFYDASSTAGQELLDGLGAGRAGASRWSSSGSARLPGADAPTRWTSPARSGSSSRWTATRSSTSPWSARGPPG